MPGDTRCTRRHTPSASRQYFWCQATHAPSVDARKHMPLCVVLPATLTTYGPLCTTPTLVATATSAILAPLGCDSVHSALLANALLWQLSLLKRPSLFWQITLPISSNVAADSLQCSQRLSLNQQLWSAVAALVGLSPRSLDVPAAHCVWALPPTGGQWIG